MPLHMPSPAVHLEPALYFLGMLAVYGDVGASNQQFITYADVHDVIRVALSSGHCAPGIVLAACRPLVSAYARTQR